MRQSPRPIATYCKDYRLDTSIVSNCVLLLGYVVAGVFEKLESLKVTTDDVGLVIILP